MSVRRIATPVAGGWRIVDEVDEWEGDHEWCPRYELVDGVSETIYPTEQEARTAL